MATYDSCKEDTTLRHVQISLLCVLVFSFCYMCQDNSDSACWISLVICGVFSQCTEFYKVTAESFQKGKEDTHKRFA